MLIKSNTSQSLFKKVKNIELSTNSFDLIDYTALWKSFEHELIINKVKADLVQFNGYYQYKNDLIYLIEFNKIPEKEINVWKVIEAFFNDYYIGKINPIRFFANNIELTEDEMINVFQELRKIGFEIRNTNTNPEIPLNNYLVPYKFPSLTNLSVQFNKNL